MPYTVSRMFCQILFAADLFSSSVMTLSFSHAVQVVIVVAAELTLAYHVSLPGLDLRHYERQQPQAVVRRQDRHTEHVAEYAEHEQRLHRGAKLERLLRDLVARQPVEELAQRLLPPALGRRAIVPPAMTQLVGVAAVAVVAWFAAGTIWNVRKGSALMRWMQGGPDGGLRTLGGRTTVRWLGSTAVEMAIREATAPFAEVTLVIFLEPRDLPWWPLSRLRGRRDTLIVRGILRQAPKVELEALDPKSWSGRDALARVPREWPVRQAVERGGIVVHHANAAALERADALLALARGKGLAVARLSVRRSEPSFQIHVRLPDRRQPAREFFEAVQALAELARA
jgi:hypothetical protein